MIVKQLGIVLFVLSFISAAFAAGPPMAGRFDVNDAAWLWPVPNDTSQLIAMDQLKATDGTLAWSEDAFKALLTAIDNAGTVTGETGDVTRIAFPDPLRSRGTWKLAAFRVDPSAPGCSPELQQTFGTSPQIRLIVQPVEQSQGKVLVHDFAVHLVFAFVAGTEPSGPESFPRTVPDRELFANIVKDLLAIKGRLKALNLDTGGPLGVHPALAAGGEMSAKARAEAMEFLGRYLHPRRLIGMSAMGLPAPDPEPWIFLALLRRPDGSYVPFPSPGLDGPVAQMLSFREARRVVPSPQPNNLSPPTAKIGVPPNERRGVSTAVLFGDADLDAAAVIGLNADGSPMLDGKWKNRDIPGIIANPRLSHFFNTDCISCHTETRRSLRLSLDLNDTAFGFVRPEGISGVDTSALPKDDWNVRNFGWFPPSPFIGGGPPVPTVTRRTANEAAEVTATINREYLGAPR